MTQDPSEVGSTGPACTLSPTARSGRLDRWQALAARGRHREVGPGQVRSVYPPDPVLLAELGRLVDAEGDCCAFLEFAVSASPEAVAVELRHPPSAAGMVAAMLGAPTGWEASPPSP